MRTLTDNHMPQAIDGLGRAAVTDPDEIDAFMKVLDQHPVVQEVGAPDVGQALSQVVKLTRYMAGYALMSAGQASESVALVLAGRCRVWDPEDPKEIVAFIGPGDVLGEMGALTGEPRGMTVGAVRDTVVAELDLASLDGLEPLARARIDAWLARLVARRALGLSEARRQSMTLALVGEDQTQVAHLAELMAEAGRHAGERWAVRTPADWPGTLPIRALDQTESEHDFVLLVADKSVPGWAESAARQADRLLTVVDGESEARSTYGDVLARAIATPHILVLMQPADAKRASGTARWIQRTMATMHLHVRRGRVEDAARCMRLVTGRGRGLAFAGASSRGLGYSGMLAAFEEVGLQLDIISGNSSGSMAAACLAFGLNCEQTSREYQQGFAAMRPHWRNLTLPLVSLLDGARTSWFLRKVFGDVQIEDLLVPVVITAVDMTSLSLVELRTGPLWRAVRASTSLPVYYPPLVFDRQVLVDGGVLQNVPVEPLQPWCRDGFVVIGDLSQDPDGFTDMEPYGTRLSGWRTLLRLLWPFGRRRKYPLVPEMVFRTACLASLKNQADLMKDLDPSWLYVRPETPPIGLFAATPEQIPRIVADTRAATLAALRSSEREPVIAALASAQRPD